MLLINPHRSYKVQKLHVCRVPIARCITLRIRFFETRYSIELIQLMNENPARTGKGCGIKIDNVYEILILYHRYKVNDILLVWFVIITVCDIKLGIKIDKHQDY